jgi:tetratricopeptide (TPR) repeat protein
MDSLLYANRHRARESASVRRDAAKHALENAQKLEPNSPETLLALGYYEYRVLRDYAAAKTTFRRVIKMLPGSSEASIALATVARREGHWGESVAYFERALALDPRNMEFLMDAAATYGIQRKFPAALKLYDRVLDITPNNPDVMAVKASIYQAQGELQEAAGLLTQLSEQTASGETFYTKVLQLRLERNYDEAIQLLQSRQAQFHFNNQFDKAFDQVALALLQRLAGDAAGANVTAEQARNALEQLSRDQPDNAAIAAWLSPAYAVLGEKDSALKAAERAIMLLPPTKDAMAGPGWEENLAFIQATFGDKSSAISALTKLLQTGYASLIYCVAPITPALLRLDPIWDPLRSDPAFQKLCEEKKP